ncbi:hypothetical protein DCO48_07190 [Pseudomonas sp. SDI]|uniref:hypothetical protein n=1 Tax=Pseudomonas sp. SDI TaxID=2170734 RepID=UPI000DE76591|nr:hypothetical protein [Pseudomonas sp. SDI]PWB34076.1 hypothetical protein DCO48_07190 [Pseudomonas sp. SDI]
MDDQSSTKHTNLTIRMKVQIAEILLSLFTAELQSIVRDSDFRDDAEHGIANSLPVDSETLIHVGWGSGKTIFGTVWMNALTKALDEAEQARKALDFIASYCRFIELTPSLEREVKYWLEVLAFARATVAKLLVLFAYSRCSFLKLPLFADGPELNGYKHRLR